MAAVTTKSRTCQGCGRKTDNSQHCAYPSNPAANAEARGKHRAELCEAEICVSRREKGNAIKSRNRANSLGGSNLHGAWWEGNPRMVKVGTAEKGGGDVYAMMSQRYSDSRG